VNDGAGGAKPIALVLVAAVAENDVIGRDNAMPWRLKSDMQHFAALTRGKPVIMGRKTFGSIGKPLKDRTNIVVSRAHDFTAAGIVVVPSVEAALLVARGDALRRGADIIAVIGGGDIYAQTLSTADRLVITRVHARPEGDARFPAIDPNVWREIDRREHPCGPDDDAAVTFLTFERITARGANAVNAG